MSIAMERRTPAATVARVLFDEAHSEAWTIRADLAEAMQPAHPQDSSYAQAASALAERDFTVRPNAAERLDPIRRGSARPDRARLA